MKTQDATHKANQKNICAQEITLDELQAILHSKPLNNSTPSMAFDVAKYSSSPTYCLLFLQRKAGQPKKKKQKDI